MPEPIQGKVSSTLPAKKIIVAAFCTAFLLFLIVPFVNNIAISMVLYNYSKGIWNSPYAGLENYRLLFGDQFFSQALLRTISFSLITGLALFTLSLPVGLLVSAMGLPRWLRHGLCTLLLVPLIVPQEIWAKLFLALFTGHWIKTPWLLAVWPALRYVGLPALLVSAADAHGRRGWPVILMAGGLVSLLMFSTLGRLDYTFYRTINSPYIITLDTYIPRLLSNDSNSFSEAAKQNLHTVLNVVLFATAAFPAVAFARRLFPAGGSLDGTTSKERLRSLAVSGSVLVAAAAVLLAVLVGSNPGGNGYASYASLPVYILIAFVTAAINTAICFLLARHIACAGNRGRKALLFLLLVLTAATMGSCSIGEYLFFRSMGLFNNYFAILASGLASVWGIWLLLLTASGTGVRSDKTEWFRRMWKPALAVFTIQAVLVMNNAIPSIIYFDKPSLYHPLTAVMYARSIAGLPGEAPSLAVMSLATMIVPVILLLGVRTAMDENESLGLFLPGN